VVEASCEEGRLVFLNISPPHRRKDVVFAGEACHPSRHEANLVEVEE